MSDQQPGARHRPRVAVVFGGRSSEHAVSCVTAGSVLRALDREIYDVVPVGITRDGRWVLVADDPDRLAIRDGRLPEIDAAAEGPPGSDVLLAPGAGRGPALVVTEPGRVPQVLGEVDVVLPLLHGPFGEDGTLQGLLEMAGVRYVGSGVLASAMGMDKHHMKLALAGQGLPVCRSLVVPARTWAAEPDAVRGAVAQLGWPVFVKPARGGSSLGISKVSKPGDLDTAIATAQEHDPKVIVEEAVAGREVECAVLEGEAGGPPEASVVGEIRVEATHEFYDFSAKYTDETQVHLDVPADVGDTVAEDVRELSVRAFQALGCEGLARVDFFLRTDGSLLVNELNTMPGFTPFSMFPALWAASGLPYPALLDRLLRTALARPLGLR
jgi:D-alanine-D-alanine ligase